MSVTRAKPSPSNGPSVFDGTLVTRVRPGFGFGYHFSKITADTRSLQSFVSVTIFLEDSIRGDRKVSSVEIGEVVRVIMGQVKTSEVRAAMSYESEFECYSAIACIEETLHEVVAIMSADISTSTRTSFTSGVDALKRLTDLAARTQNKEVLDGLLELRSQILGIKEILLEVKEENFNFREENKRLMQNPED